MSDTPRTDLNTFGAVAVDPENGDYERDVVDADFARELERELNAAKARIEDLDRQLNENADAAVRHWRALVQANMRIKELESLLNDPHRLHAHCVRHLTDAQVAHLFGERMTVIQNRCEELEKDKARLDWLETQDCWIGVCGEYDLQPIHSCGGGYNQKVRATIDAAMKGQAQ